MSLHTTFHFEKKKSETKNKQTTKPPANNLFFNMSILGS